MSDDLPGEKKLLRPRDGAVLGGVCAAFARYWEFDVSIIRLVAVLAAVFGVGSPILIYVICWIVIPEE